MMSYLSRTGTKRNIAEAKRAGWGWMVGPLDMGGPVRESMPYACDCGAWPCFQAFLRGERPTADPDLKKFMAMVERHGPGADFIVVPDIVMGGERSWLLTRYWLRKLRRMPELRGVKLLIAVQNGFTAEMVEPYLSKRVGIFIGGDTEWKLATLRMWGALALKHGALCHCGRVNTARRIALCGKADGVTSFDGTSGTRFAKTIRPLERARYTAVLDRAQVDIEDLLKEAA